MRRRSRTINPHAHSQRSGLRLIGAILAITGGIFAAVGFASFFSAFGGGGMPTKFWCAFVGLPLLGIGIMMLKIGYMGAAARYVAGEVAPVASDTLNYMADETRGSVRKMAAAVSEGMRSSATATVEETADCSACGHCNDADARFCDQCGNKMPGPNTCSDCGKVNDADARFCDGCGTGLA